jgi:CXXX repeat peptide maturase
MDLKLIKYLIILLEDNANSFCYFNCNNKSKNNLIDIDILSKIPKLVDKNNLFVNLLYGTKKIPANYQKIIDKINHIKYIPINSPSNNQYEGNILLLNTENINLINNLKDNNNNLNIIFRIKKNELKKLYNIFNSLLGKFKRFNITLLDIPEYKENDFDIYKEQLKKIGNVLIKEYKNAKPIEFNVISDRIFLNKMNNCNAGIDHITLATNGKFYICPGFYYDDPNDSIGDLKKGINIKNNQLLELENAPICKICDAYHCKRCIWLNKKTTLEINTPSHQQCILSHIEREISKNILNELHNTPNFNDFNNINPIPEIDYNDPLDIITGDAKGIIHKKNFQKQNEYITIKDGDKLIKLPKLKQVKPQNENDYISLKDNNRPAISPNLRQMNQQSNIDDYLQNLSTKDLLIEIYKMQKEILKEFNKR